MRVENLTRDTVLVDRGRLANNFWTRLRGLIGVRDLPAGDGMLITPCTSVHCMFMSIPIDVVYVDKQDRVVGMDRALRPWRLGTFFRRVRYVVELPAGTIDRTGTQPGDALRVA
jgi:uncharacterized protein